MNINHDKDFDTSGFCNDRLMAEQTNEKIYLSIHEVDYEKNYWIHRQAYLCKCWNCCLSKMGFRENNEMFAKASIFCVGES